MRSRLGRRRTGDEQCRPVQVRSTATSPGLWGSGLARAKGATPKRHNQDSARAWQQAEAGRSLTGDQDSRHGASGLRPEPSFLRGQPQRRYSAVLPRFVRRSCLHECAPGGSKRVLTSRSVDAATYRTPTKLHNCRSRVTVTPSSRLRIRRLGVRVPSDAQQLRGRFGKPGRPFFVRSAGGHAASRRPATERWRLMGPDAQQLAGSRSFRKTSGKSLTCSKRRCNTPNTATSACVD